jgi:hypothetical protein
MITVSVLLEEGIGGKLAGLAAGGAKEIAVGQFGFDWWGC